MGDFPSLLIMLLLQKRKACFFLFRVLSFPTERIGNEGDWQAGVWSGGLRWEMKGGHPETYYNTSHAEPMLSRSRQNYDLGFLGVCLFVF